jgi:hypothetical protein
MDERSARQADSVRTIEMGGSTCPCDDGRSEEESELQTARLSFQQTDAEKGAHRRRKGVVVGRGNCEEGCSDQEAGRDWPSAPSAGEDAADRRKGRASGVPRRVPGLGLAAGALRVH